VLFLVAPVFATTDSYYGGPGRLMALGNISFVAPETSNIIDLYSLGMTGGILLRPQVSVINLYPNLIMMAYNRESSTSYTDMQQFTLGSGQYRNINNGIIVWLNDSAVMVIRPILSGMAGFNHYVSTGMGTTEDANHMFDSNLSGEFELAMRFSDLISAALTGGYLRYDWGSDNTQDGEMSHYLFSKINYQASLLLTPGGEWSYSFGFGNRGANGFLIPNDMGISEFFIDVQAYVGSVLDGSGFFNGYVDDDGTTIDTENTDFIMQLMRADMAAAYKGEGKTSFAVKLALLFGLYGKHYNYEDSKDIGTGIVTVNTDEFRTFVQEGMGVDLDLQARLDWGTFLPALRLRYVRAWTLAYLDSGTMRSYQPYFLDITGGAGIQLSDGLLIPIEIFYNKSVMYSRAGTKDSYMEVPAAGVRLGAEFGANTGFVIRIGLDTSLNGYNSVNTDNGVITSESDPMGSDDNPFYAQAGFNAGFGFKDESWESNIGVRYQADYRIPGYTGTTKARTNTVKIVTDVKWYIQ